jgi:ribose 5-phosphate isomerase B
MNIFIASDHGGFELKNNLVTWLTEQNLGEVIDMGPSALNPDDDYPTFAFPVAEKVVATSGSVGILICRSGNGMAIAANKVKGARAALCFSAKHAQKAVEHDHANILVLDADYTSDEENLEVVSAFLSAKPEEGRHARRVAMIEDYEVNHHD